MNIQSIINNELTQDEFSVWRLKDHTNFGYSDGAASEKYLHKVFDQVHDLSTHSTELESHIKDWPSEYHLSRKRAHLLSGFAFDPSLRVLEVGCGCGAITRHLGENFDQVVSVEGNMNRAHLARKRAKDLESVSVVCAPFQEIQFSQKFDIIFCIGVFEYSGSFIQGDDPYDAALQYFHDMLTPNGMVVIAIENQFGLKYFSGAREDHLGVRFEGIQGYHQFPRRARTFGKVELDRQLRKYFRHIEFYYPYPDYKIPDCVISSDFLESGHAGELISQLPTRDYSGFNHMRWDEASTTLELARNKMLEFFSHSFLVLAGRSTLSGVNFNQLAIMHSSGRKPMYSTKTRIIRVHAGKIVAKKQRASNDYPTGNEPLKLVETESSWINTLSIYTQVNLRARNHTTSLSEIFEPCKKWVESLIANSYKKHDIRWLEGVHVDSIWPNAYISETGCNIIDREWVWEEKIRMNVVVIRAIYDFLSKTETAGLRSKALSIRSGRQMIRDISKAIGIQLEAEDFTEFIQLESEIACIVSGINKFRYSLYIRWFLINRSSRRFARCVTPIVKSILSRIHAKFEKLA